MRAIRQLMNHFLDTATTTGNPYRQVAEHRPAAVRMQRVRVVREGWYGIDRQPVKVGDEFKLPMHDALNERHFGRVEFVE